MKAISVGRAIDLFLAHLADAASPKSRAWYTAFLREFRLFAGERRLRDITPSVLHKWIAKRYGERSPSTQHAAGRCVCRLMNWAVDEGRLDASPLRKFRNITPSSRETILSGADYAALVRTADPPLRDAVKFLWHTGARPQELRTIEAPWIGDRKITLPRKHSKGKKKRRVIYLDSMAGAIAVRRAERYPEGPIFRNRLGKPWTADALARAFSELAKSAKVQAACAYAIRHTWITAMLEKGAGVATVAALAGNSPAIVMRVYSHVAENEEHLRSHLG